jgi:ASC-1-like (ASCH) protein/mannose-6-phosphate isomerase-like protein (cupin superfamily)
MDITKITIENNSYRKIIKTSSHMQLVIMSLLPGEDIPLETHDTYDQFFNVVDGKCLIEANGELYRLGSGMIMIIKAGTPHYVKNLSSTKKLKLYTIYSPPEHPDGLIQEFKTTPYLLDKNQSGGSIKDFVKLYKKYKFKYLNLKQIGGAEPIIWKVHVSLPWFTLIKEGKKTVEGRPNRKDFAQMKVGDKIEFFNKELNENFMAEITNVSHHKTFEEMIKSNGIDNVLPGIRNLDEGVEVYMQYYNKNIEAEYGVVGIRVLV